LADDFPNAAMAGQFLDDHGFKRTNRHKKTRQEHLFVATGHGDGQPSGIVLRGEGETYFFDYDADTRYVMGGSDLLKDERPGERQFRETMSIAAMDFHR
jgi:uncharacterized protein with von Willebrand factor type A (vWA) domain